MDSLKSSTNKYNTAAKQQGVKRSLVIESEKNRSKLLAELTLSKVKKNTGGAGPMRQRGSIAKNRFQRTDKYPLTSNILLAEFKLRRTARSNVSKPWFKKKIENRKSKIEDAMARKKLQNLKKAATGSRDSRKDTTYY